MEMRKVKTGGPVHTYPENHLLASTEDRRGDGPRIIEIICPDCGGEGGNQVSWYATGRNYHLCRTCEGEGTVEIEVDGEEDESE